VNGQPQPDPGAGIAEVNVIPGDIVEWRSTRSQDGGPHGITFREFPEAQTFLEFDTSVGEEIKPQQRFGPNAQGTDGFDSPLLLKRATVKSQASLSQLTFTCTIHGPGRMNGRLNK
jgi:hypothetical protein